MIFLTYIQQADLTDIIQEIEHMAHLGRNDYIIAYECGFVSLKRDMLWVRSLFVFFLFFFIFPHDCRL